MKTTALFKDFLVAVVLTVVAYAIFGTFDVFDRWYEFSRAHESWELDEIPGALAGTLIGLCWFAFRRWREAEERAVAVEKAEAAAEAVERQFLAAIDSLPLGIMFFDQDDNLALCNEFFRQKDPAGKHVLMGRSFEDNVRNWVDNGVVPDLNGDKEEAIRKFVALHKGPDEVFEQRVKGGYIEIQEHSTPGGGTLTITQDISERKWAEESLRNSAEFQRRLIDAMPLPAFYKNFEGKYLGCNSAFAEFFGVDKVDVIGKTVFEFAPSDLAKTHTAADEELIRNGGAQTYETPVRAGDGSIHTVILSKAVFRAAGERSGGIVGVWVDVTDRIQMEDALRHRETQLRAVLDNSPASIYLKDIDGRFLLVNDAFVRRNGISEAEALGRVSSDFLPQETAALIDEEEREVIERRTPRTSERPLVYGDGSAGAFMVTKFPVIDPEGELVGVGSISTDVTERHEMEEQSRRLHAELAQVSRLGTMGELASGFAHELNQPLAAITNYVTGVLRRLRAGDEDVQKFIRVLELVAEQSRRASTTISRIRKFIGKEQPEKTPICVNHPIQAAIGLIESDLIGAKAKLESKFGSPLPRILGDAVQIQQVVLNLLKNSVEAVREDGTPLHIVVQSEESADGGVTVSVEDNGRGLSEAVRHHLFEPFFTTKENGMGIGLLVCRKIIEEHDGVLEVTPLEAGGTRVAFSLPPCEAVSDSEIEVGAD